MTTTNETTNANETKAAMGFSGKTHAVTLSVNGRFWSPVCGGIANASARLVEGGASAVTCARCLKKLGRENLH